MLPKDDDKSTAAMLGDGMEKHRLLKGYTYAGLGAAFFSTKAIFIKLAYMEQANAALMLALRMMVALPFFIGVGLYAVHKLRQQGKPLPGWGFAAKALFAGLIGYYLSSILDFMGLAFISAQLERLVLFTYPIFVMFLGWMFFGARLTPYGIIGAAITYAGLVVVFLTDLPGGGRATVIGTMLVLACALTFAVYQLLAKGLITAMGSALFTAIAMTGSGVASIINFVVVSGGADFSSSPRFFWLAAGTGFFATVLPSFLVNAGLSRISPQSTSMIATFSPVLTIFLAVMILGEPFTLADAIGSTMVIAGVALYALTDRRPKPAQAT
jgi:drug/metabolite transporter (DMT)-like permease